MIYLVAFAVLAAVSLVVVRICIRRDERWIDEQIRLDEQARR